MCCCGKPTINGQPGYSWDGKTFSTRQPSPPDLQEGDTLLWDEPGRCGGIDAHAHHFRLVKRQYGGRSLLVRHGGGDERIALGCTADLFLPTMEAADSNARYWFLHTVYSAHRDAESAAEERERSRWRIAAAEKRIKVRKLRGRPSVRVTIEPPKPAAIAA